MTRVRHASKGAVRRWLERQALRALVLSASAAARILPMSAMRAAGMVVGSLVYHMFPARRAAAERNLEECFPGRFTEAEKKAVVLRSCQNITASMAELLKLRWMSAEQVLALVAQVEGYEEHFKPAYEQGRGVIVATAHFGNFEFLGLWVQVMGHKLAIVVREPSDAIVARIVYSCRACRGARVLSRDETLAMARFLKGGGVLGILPDQRVIKGGAKLKFLGREASTPLGPGLLAAMTGSPVVPGFARRGEDGRFDIVFHEPILPRADVERAGEAVRIMQLVNDAISAEIEQRPEQWLWFHDRWKYERADGAGCGAELEPAR